MPKLKDYSAFSITALLILVPFSIILKNQLVSSTLTPPTHCLPISHSTSSLCVYCLSKKQSSIRSQASVQVEDDHSFKVLKTDQGSTLNCQELTKLVDYDKNIQTTQDIDLQRSLLEKIDGKIKFEYISASQNTYHIQKRVPTFLIVQLTKQSEFPSIKFKYPSPLGVRTISKFISIEALAAIFTAIVYAIIRVAKGNHFRKEIFVNLTILVLILASLIYDNQSYLLGYTRCLYIALCLCMINTEKIFILLPMFLLIFNNNLLSCVGLTLAFSIFLFQFILNPTFSHHISYIGSCLFILTVNFVVMEFFPHLLNDYPLQIIELSTVCTSTVLMEMLEGPFKAKPQPQVKTGPSLTGFQEITNEDEDF